MLDDRREPNDYGPPRPRRRLLRPILPTGRSEAAEDFGVRVKPEGRTGLRAWIRDPWLLWKPVLFLVLWGATAVIILLQVRVPPGTDIFPQVALGLLAVAAVVFVALVYVGVRIRLWR